MRRMQSLGWKMVALGFLLLSLVGCEAVKGLGTGIRDTFKAFPK